MIESSQPSNLLPDSESDSQGELSIFSYTDRVLHHGLCVWVCVAFQWSASSFEGASRILDREP